MNPTLYSYIDVVSAHEITLRVNAPDGIVVQLRDLTDNSMSSLSIHKEELPELAYVLLNIANEIVSPPQRLLK